MPSDRHTILYFSSFGNLRWGGQKSLYHLATRLDRSTFRAHVVVPCEDGLADALRKAGIGVTVLDLPPVALGNARRVSRALSAVHELIGRLDARVVHTDGPRNTLYAGLAARLRKRPLVWHIRASDRDPYDRLLYGLSSRVVLVARSLRSRFDWVAGDGKFTVIYNGVDTREFTADSDPSRGLMARLGIDGRRVLIATFTRLEPSKGQIHLIEACAALRHIGADFHIVVAGEIADRAYCAHCRRRAQELGIGDRVAFTGHIDGAARFLAEVDIVAGCSVSGEAFPRATIESMAAGRPVVVTAVGGAPEAVAEGVTGYVVAPGNVEALRVRIVHLVQDAGLRKRMGDAARRRAETLYSIDGNVQKTESLYGEVLEGMSRG